MHITHITIQATSNICQSSTANSPLKLNKQFANWFDLLAAALSISTMKTQTPSKCDCVEELNVYKIYVTFVYLHKQPSPSYTIAICTDRLRNRVITIHQKL